MKKRILAIVLSLVMVIGLMPSVVFAQGETPAPITANYEWYGDGSATEFTISSVEDLAGLAKLTQGAVEGKTEAATNFLGKTVKLGAYITFATNQYWYYSDGTTTYNYVIKDFAGTFDGNNKTITGLKINNTVSSKSGLGLFSSISGIVKDLTLDDVTGAFADGNQFGLLSANLTGNATNCHMTSVTMTSARRVPSSGMMFGAVTGNASVIGCTLTGFTGTWSGDDNTDQVGALIGRAAGTAGNIDQGIEEIRVNISNCSISDVSFSFSCKTKHFGAFIGKTDYTDVSGCSASDITIYCANYCYYTGGFVGYAGSGSVYTGCKVNGFKMVCDTEQWAGSVGGFAGIANGSGIGFNDCNVTGLDWDLSLGVDYGIAIGGFAGQVGNAEFEDCSASGDIEATGGRDRNIPVGGFLGEAFATVNVEGCAAAVDIVATGPASGFIGACTGGNSTFTDCEASGDVKSLESVAGGFIGSTNNGTFDGCSTTGNVEGVVAGGFAGELVPNTKDTENKSLTISNSSASGQVLGSTVASGFAGTVQTGDSNESNNTNVKIENSSAAPLVAGTSKDTVVAGFAQDANPEGVTAPELKTEGVTEAEATLKILGDGELTMVDGKIVIPDGSTVQFGDGEPIYMEQGGEVILYTVTLNADGGSVSPDSIGIGVDKILHSLPTPTKSGYIFDGWYDAMTGGNKVNVGAEISVGTTLYARWVAFIAGIEKTSTVGKVDTYTITYGDGSTSTFTITNGTDGATGAEGKKVELQVTDTHIQWRYVGESEWKDLIALELLKGADGLNGSDGSKGDAGTNGTDGKEVELQVTYSYIQWRHIGDAEWKNLVALADIIGAKGTDGKDGVNGTDGKDGTNGKDGLTPFIGENGNWWIGTTDTGVKAAVDGIISAKLNENGELIITLADGSTFRAVSADAAVQTGADVSDNSTDNTVKTLATAAFVMSAITLLWNVIALVVSLFKKKKSIVR